MSPGVYRAVYWETDLADMGLRFLLVWEVFHHTFPKGSGLHKIVSKGFAVAAFGLVIFSIGAVWSYEAYSRFHSVYPVIERSFGFAQAVMILGVIADGTLLWRAILDATSGELRLPLERGHPCLLRHNAMIDLHHSFLPYWQLLLPLSCVAMFAAWVRAVWVYAPNPAIATQDTRISRQIWTGRRIVGVMPTRPVTEEGHSSMIELILFATVGLGLLASSPSAIRELPIITESSVLVAVGR